MPPMRGRGSGSHYGRARAEAAMSFCAVCSRTITGPVHREPLGRNDAMVDVCHGCATEPAVAYRGPGRGYEGAGATLSVDDSRAAMKRVLGDRYDGERRRILAVQ